MKIYFNTGVILRFLFRRCMDLNTVVSQQGTWKDPCRAKISAARRG